MFEARTTAQASMPGGASPTKGVEQHYILSPVSEDLSSATRFYVHGHQHIFLRKPSSTSTSRRLFAETTILAPF